MQPDIDEGSVTLRITGFDVAFPNDFTTDDKHEPAESQVFDVFARIRAAFRTLTWPGRKPDKLERLHLKATHAYHLMVMLLSEFVAFGDDDHGHAVLHIERHCRVVG